MSVRHYTPYQDIDIDHINFALGADRHNKPSIALTYGAAGSEVAMVSCPAITMWPRVTGDGNFGTMWGPADITKAKFTLDWPDTPISGSTNEHFNEFRTKMEEIDERLLTFVADNQLMILGR